MDIRDCIIAINSIIIFTLIVFVVNNHQQVLLNKRLTEALYSEFQYKYDPNDNVPKTLFDENSWLTALRKTVTGDNYFFFSSNDKTVLQRLSILEEKDKE